MCPLPTPTEDMTIKKFTPVCGSIATCYRGDWKSGLTMPHHTTARAASRFQSRLLRAVNIWELARRGYGYTLLNENGRSASSGAAFSEPPIERRSTLDTVSLRARAASRLTPLIRMTRRPVSHAF